MDSIASSLLGLDCLGVVARSDRARSKQGQRVLDVRPERPILPGGGAPVHEAAVGVGPLDKDGRIGVEKVERAKLLEACCSPIGACALRAADALVDAAMMAFGIRNVADRPRRSRSWREWSDPGGRIAILEASEASHHPCPLARFHSRVVVPRVASLFLLRKAYEYLETSIRAFPPPEVFRG